jgi:hypothetical protein
VAVEAGSDFDPRRIGELPGLHEERRTSRPWYLGLGSLTCPDCDAPVSLGGQRAAPTDPLACPFCSRDGAVREFVSLTPPLRAPRVHVFVRYDQG